MGFARCRCRSAVGVARAEPMFILPSPKALAGSPSVAERCGPAQHGPGAGYAALLLIGASR